MDEIREAALRVLRFVDPYSGAWEVHNSPEAPDGVEMYEALFLSLHVPCSDCGADSVLFYDGDPVCRLHHDERRAVHLETVRAGPKDGTLTLTVDVEDGRYVWTGWGNGHRATFTTWDDVELSVRPFAESGVKGVALMLPDGQVVAYSYAVVDHETARKPDWLPCARA